MITSTGSFLKNILTFLLCLFLQQAFAQGWEKTYDINNNDDAVRIFNSDDDGFIIGGRFNTTPGYSILKTDVEGNLLWTKNSSNSGRLNDMQPTSDGGYIVTGSGSFKMFIAKLNNDLDTVWLTTVDTSSHIHGWKVLEATNGDFIVAGEYFVDVNDTNTKLVVFRFNHSGTLIYQKHFGAELGVTTVEQIRPKSISEGENDEFYIWVDYTSDSYSRHGIIKVNGQNGDVIWVNPFDSCLSGYIINSNSPENTFFVVAQFFNSETKFLEVDSSGAIIAESILDIENNAKIY